MTKTLIVAYDRFEPILDIIEKVVNLGVPKEAVSLIAKNTENKHDHLLKHKMDMDVEAPEGAVVGGITGALMGIGLSIIALPGAGPLLIGGPLAVAIGAGVGTLTGGISAALIELGVSEEEANVYVDGLPPAHDSLLVLQAVPEGLLAKVQKILNSYPTVRLIQRKPE